MKTYYIYEYNFTHVVMTSHTRWWPQTIGDDLKHLVMNLNTWWWPHKLGYDLINIMTSHTLMKMPQHYDDLTHLMATLKSDDDAALLTICDDDPLHLNISSHNWWQPNKLLWSHTPDDNLTQVMTTYFTFLIITS